MREGAKEVEEGKGSIGNTVNLVLISALHFFSPFLLAADTVFLVLSVTHKELERRRRQAQHESRRRDKIDSALAVSV